MYKLVLVVLLGFIATENNLASADIGSLPPSNATCERGMTYYGECSVCNCDNNGVLHCTQKHCTEQETDNKIGDGCTPGSTFNLECNVCTCAENGREATCTLKSCLPSHRSRRVTRELSCTPGKQFKIDCNTCVCSNDGKTTICKLMGCLSSENMFRKKRAAHETGEKMSQQEHQTEDAGAQRCDPGSHFMQDCNTCICSIDGIVAHASCTINLCRNKRAIRSCEPGSAIQSDCNTCMCSEDGKTFSCTNKNCQS